MWKHNGFFMADLLLSMSTWMLISITLLPIGVDFLKESLEEKDKYKATVILYEKLHEIVADNEILPQHMMIRNGKQYEFIPRIDEKEVCIEFENTHHKKESVCEFLE